MYVNHPPGDAGHHCSRQLPRGTLTVLISAGLLLLGLMALIAYTSEYQLGIADVIAGVSVLSLLFGAIARFVERLSCSCGR